MKANTENAKNNEPTTQVGSGGILNRICSNYGLNSKSNTISVQNLIRYHKPKNQQELRYLIATHEQSICTCKCGSKANGTIDDWAQKLHNAYLLYKMKSTKEIPYKNLGDCKIFMEYLFIKGSIKGGEMEDIALNIFKKAPLIINGGFKVTKGTEEDDFKYSVDLIITDKGNNTLMGIQVKPESYMGIMKTNRQLHLSNLRKNERFGSPVVYIYYKEDGTFVKTKDFVANLKHILSNSK